jgi:hypothetical protein
MYVEEYYDKSYCDNCDDYTYVFLVKSKNGSIELRLCKKCLLQLLKAIIER